MIRVAASAAEGPASLARHDHYATKYGRRSCAGTDACGSRSAGSCFVKQEPRETLIIPRPRRPTLVADAARSKSLMLLLPGAPALSPFRLEKLLAALRSIDPRVESLTAHFHHFVDLARELSTDEARVLARLVESDVAPVPPAS